MRKRLGAMMAACFYYSGLVGWSRWTMQRAGKRLIILNYHRASGGDLRRHMLYLRRYYRVMHLEDALQELFAPETTKPAGADRRTPLVLTFDDGYYDNYSHAFPLARSLHVPITIFLVPGYIESGNYFWWRAAHYLVKHASVESIVVKEQKYHLNREEEATKLIQVIDEQVRFASSVAEREAFLTTISEELGVPRTVSLTPAEEAERPLTWAEILEMEQSGWVSFGAHTMHHPVLAYLKDASELAYEVGECRVVLEQKLGHPVRSFAYPIGRSEHIGTTAVQAVREAGYDWAVTTVHGVNTPQSDPPLLGRVRGDVTRNWLVMAAEVSGLWNLLSPLWKLVIGKGESA